MSMKGWDSIVGLHVENRVYPNFTSIGSRLTVRLNTGGTTLGGGCGPGPHKFGKKNPWGI